MGGCCCHHYLCCDLGKGQMCPMVLILPVAHSRLGTFVLSSQGQEGLRLHRQGLLREGLFYPKLKLQRGIYLIKMTCW